MFAAVWLEGGATLLKYTYLRLEIFEPHLASLIMKKA